MSPKSPFFGSGIIPLLTHIFGRSPLNVFLQMSSNCCEFKAPLLKKKDEVISELLLWEPKHGARKRGRPARTCRPAAK